MNPTLRVMITGFSTLAAFYFTFWIPGSLLELPAIVMTLISGSVAWFTGSYVWKSLDGNRHGILASAFKWAAIIGGVSFCLGFFGPIIFSPQSNQGPLLGLFITGPIGFLLGGVGGAIYASINQRR